MSYNLKDFYLETFMNRYEYMCIPVKDIPQDIMDQYNLAPLTHRGHLFVKLRKGMYGLPQAGILATKERLKKYLAI